MPNTKLVMVLDAAGAGAVEPNETPVAGAPKVVDEFPNENPNGTGVEEADPTPNAGPAGVVLLVRPKLIVTPPPTVT